jgi:hypothetical protein
MSPTFTANGLWWLLGVVVGGDEGSRMFVANPTDEVQAMERAGLIWLKRTPGGHLYCVQATDEGARLVRRWTVKCAKEAARQFGRIPC